MKKLNLTKIPIWIKIHKKIIITVIVTVLLVVLVHAPIWFLIPKMESRLQKIHNQEKIIQTQKETIKDLKEKNKKS